MHTAPKGTNPTELTYLTLRKSVGWIAITLPFALVIPWWIVGTHVLPTSISGYYYTGMRNLFEGSLCAIAMFNFCCRGYDWKDETAGIFSALCAFGVAFCPTRPGRIASCTPPGWVPPSLHQRHVGEAHVIFATFLFLTLAYFCLGLFTKTTRPEEMTRRKVQRNRVYIVCGWTILASMVCIGVFHLLKREYLIGELAPLFCFETTSLIAFGIAWLVKGETILKDPPTPEHHFAERMEHGEMTNA